MCIFVRTPRSRRSISDNMEASGRTRQIEDFEGRGCNRFLIQLHILEFMRIFGSTYVTRGLASSKILTDRLIRNIFSVWNNSCGDRIVSLWFCKIEAGEQTLYEQIKICFGWEVLEIDAKTIKEEESMMGIGLVTKPAEEKVIYMLMEGKQCCSPSHL